MFSSYITHYAFHLIAVSILTLIGCSSISSNSIYGAKNNTFNSLLKIYSLILIVTVGFRPERGDYGDTFLYTIEYYNMANKTLVDFGVFNGDKLFGYTMYLFAQIFPVSVFYTFYAIIYVVGHIVACNKMMQSRSEILVLVCFSAYSFFSYSCNGVRNGAACALFLVALSYVLENKSGRNLIIASIFGVCAIGIHKSTALPVASLFCCMCYMDTKKYIYFWFLSILISLVAGSQVEALFSSIGFDDRMANYSQNHEYDYMFSHTGFRWDFLIYSFMPILLGYYIVIKRQIHDMNYSVLLNLYILCNSFWVMVIRTTSSNRFAYLSWFLYPIVLAYPLLSFPVFKTNNTRKVQLCILAHTTFTVFMWLIGK